VDEPAQNKSLLAFRTDLHELFHKHPAGHRTLRRLMSYYGVFSVVNSKDARTSDIVLAKSDVILEIIKLAAIPESTYRNWSAISIHEDDLTLTDTLRLIKLSIKLCLKKIHL
jgi:hypothetical protein